MRLLLGAREDIAPQVGQQPIMELERREVGRALRVHHVHELGAVHGVRRREDAARVDAVLHEECDRPGAIRRAPPRGAVALEPRAHLLVPGKMLIELLPKLVHVGDASLLLAFATFRSFLRVGLAAVRWHKPVDLLHLIREYVVSASSLTNE